MWTIVTLLVPTLSALAHEGEVHEGPATKVPITLPGAGLRAVNAATESFEVVIKHPPLDPNREGTLTLFLSDYRTNAPVSNAQVQIEVPDAGISGLRAERTDRPGIYKVAIKVPKQGTYALVINVTAGDLSDLIPVEGLVVGQIEGGAEARHSGRLTWWASGAAIFLVLTGFIVWRRRSIK